jgi:hypothetical protein
MLCRLTASDSPAAAREPPGEVTHWTAQARFRDQQSQPNNGLRIGDSHFSMQFSGGFGNNQPGVDSRFVPSSKPDFANPYYTQIIPDRH